MKNNNIPAEELSGFCTQVAMLLEAGVPLYEGIRSMAETDEKSAYHALYAELSEAMNETGSLYEALGRNESWPKYLVEMAGIGERSGKLEQIMRGLSRQYEREGRVRDAIRSAIAYPMTLGVMLVLVVFVVLVLVVPVFRRVLSGMGMGLNASATRLIGIGSAVGWVVLAATAVLLVIAGTAAVLMKTKKRDRVVDFITAHVPSMRRVGEKLSTSRELAVLSMTLSGGFAAEEAIEMAGSVIEDRTAAKSLGEIAEKLRNGAQLAETIAESGQLEDLHARMLRTSASAGRETDMLDKISAIYEEDAENGIQRFVSVIEPTLVIVFSTVIGGILLAVMLPMAGLLAGLI